MPVNKAQNILVLPLIRSIKMFQALLFCNFGKHSGKSRQDLCKLVTRNISKPTEENPLLQIRSFRQVSSSVGRGI